MIWTTEKPTKEGWYWWRRKHAASTFGKWTDPMVVKMGIDKAIKGWGPVIELSGQWAGPLEPPIEKGVQ